MPATKEELTERAQLVRLFEASCGIHFPTAQDLAFRLAVMKKLGLDYGLKEMRRVEFTGTPAGGVAPTPQGPGRKPF